MILPSKFVSKIIFKNVFMTFIILTIILFIKIYQFQMKSLFILNYNIKRNIIYFDVKKIFFFFIREESYRL